MWDDVPASDLDAEFDNMIRGQNFWLLDSPRILMADSESFAEGGIGDWLEEYKETLAKYGFRFDECKDRFNEHGYDIILDDAAYTVYTEAQLNRDGQGLNTWEIATAFVQRLLNDQFRSNGIETRAYLFYGGNDGFIMLLTPQMANAMIESGLLPKKEQPFRLDSSM